MESQFILRILISLLLFITNPIRSSPIFETHFTRSSLKNATQQQYLQITHPLFSDFLYPTCNTLLLSHSFADTIGKPPVSAAYSPPESCNWSHAVLEFSVSCIGDQYDRIAAVWLNGTELLRTSTAEPTEDGVYWNVRKDITRYSSLLRKQNLTITVMLENIVNDEFTGIYDVNVSILFYFNSPGNVPAPAPSPEYVPAPAPDYVPVPAPSPEYVPVPAPSPEYAPVPAPSPAFVPVPAPSPAYVPAPVPSSFPVPGPSSVPGPFPVPLPLPVPSSYPAPEPSGSANRVIKLNRKLGFQIEQVNVKKSSMITDVLHDYNEKNVYQSPADLIIPISGNCEEGFWFRIKNESDVKSQGIQIPSNTYKAVLEVYVSFHGDDEFWYSNPPDSYILSNNLTTGRGNGAYREVLVTIDGKLVGSVFPFPVIFTGGINPLFWEPVVAIGAFNLPSYNFLLTPFLGQLLDGKEHVFGLGVAGSIQYWLVDANLHLWLDHGSSEVQAGSIQYQPPTLDISRKSSFKHLDGSFQLKATRKSEYAGWVNSSTGNLTTYVIQKLKFKNSIKFHDNGSKKSVEQKIKAKIEIRVEAQGMVMSRTIMKIEYPLDLSISNKPWSVENDSTLMLTSVEHELKAKFKGSDDISGSVENKQKSDGWMIVRDHNVLSGSADTQQEYELESELGCYWRKVTASNGWLIKDDSSFSCSSSSSSSS